MTYSILIYQLFPFTIVLSFQSNRNGYVGTIVIEHNNINSKKWNKIQNEMLQNVQHIANNNGIFH